jgi:hypothetical protein
MYVRPCRLAWHCKVEGSEWNAIRAQVLHQDLTFGAIRTNTYIHCVAMIVAPAVVQR